LITENSILAYDLWDNKIENKNKIENENLD
jgi:hypothetical protein